MSANRPTVVASDPGSADWLDLQGRLADLALGHSSQALPMAHATHARHLAFLPPEVLELDLDDPMQRDFGDYELLGKLGQGGMGVVYRARQRSLEREVAVKLLAAGPWASKDFIERFRREAQSAARMQHPNIVSIFEVGAHDELNYFSMQLVRGESLAALLNREGPQAPRRAAALLRTIAEALDYAHRLGVLHLDLKPGNVLLDERGEPMVADFGLARRLDESLAADSDEVSGTPSYMAPEQATLKTRRLTPATDVYGLGAILYELLTGRPPFLGATPQETLRRVAQAAPERPRELRADIPPDLEAICLKCLEKDARQRYPSARALEHDLAAFLDGRPVSVRPLSALERGMRAARREPRLAVALGGFVLALLVGLLATSLQWRRADNNAERARENLWVARAQSAQSAMAEGDGFRGLRQLVANLAEMEAAGRLGDAAVERQRIGTILANAPRVDDLWQLPATELVTAVAISPDGRRIAVATVGSGVPRRIRQYEMANGRETWVTPTAGLTHGAPIADALPHGSLTYSPDGTRIIARLPQQTPFAAPGGGDSIAVDALSGVPLRPPESFGPFDDLVFSADARLALVRRRTDPSLRFSDSVQLFATDTWRALGPRHARSSTGAAVDWQFTPDGESILGSGDLAKFSLFDPATMAVRWQLDLPQAEPVRAWCFSPDSRWLALGTTGGKVLLVATHDGSRHELSSGPIATVRWLAFDAAGSTLAAGSEGGEIVAWDVASGRPRAGPLRTRRQSVTVGVRIVGDTVFSADSSELRAWQLPPLAPFNNAAVAEAARLRSRRTFFSHAFDVHAASRILVSGDQDGSVRVWQLPASAILPGRAAPLPAGRLRFDGMQYAAVEGAAVELRDVLSDAARSVRFIHPEAVRVAELSADGNFLVTVAGRTVRVFDPRRGTLIGAPVVLPQTPLRLELAGNAPLLAITTGEHGAAGFEERIHAIDLSSATMRFVSTPLRAPLAEFTLDPLGRYALIAPATEQGKPSELQMVGLDGDARSCERIDLGAGVQFGAVAIADDGDSAWIQATDDTRKVQMLRFDLSRCEALARLEARQGGSAIRLVASGDNVIGQRLGVDTITTLDVAGNRRDAPGLTQSTTMIEFAVSRDGNRAVQATRNGIQLVDLQRGERLSALLQAPLAGNDAIAKLAFSPTADRVLARTVRGQWLHWRIPMATEPVAELARLAAILDPQASDPLPSAAALADERALVHALAPATQPARAAAASGEPVVVGAVPGSAIDPRFLALDLAPAINAPLNGSWPGMVDMGGDGVTFATGLQRLNGIDWRVDGAIQLSHGGPAIAIHPTQRESAEVPLAAVRAVRAHVLMMMHIPMRRGVAPRGAAFLVLRGVDGRQTRLEIQTIRDVGVSWMPDVPARSARIAWSGVFSIDVITGNASSSQTIRQLYSVALDIPPHTGPLQSLHLEAPEGQMEAPLFFAVTLERESGPADTGPADLGAQGR